MFQFVILSTILALSTAFPKTNVKALGKDSYSIEGIIGDVQQYDVLKNAYSVDGAINEGKPRSLSGDVSHIRKAPQDPVVIAGEYGGDLNDLREKTDHDATTEINCEKHQAQNAHYSFDSSVTDKINDHSITRSEERDGLKVRGMYSYSDGYYLRAVHYEADENGYRVVKEDVKRIGDGPKFNPVGRADVSGSLIGQYSIAIGDEERQPSYVEISRKRV